MHTPSKRSHKGKEVASDRNTVMSSSHPSARRRVAPEPSGSGSSPPQVPPQLPPELVGRIAFFIDTLSHVTRDKETFRDLRNGSLVCQGWRRPFQRELMLEVHLVYQSADHGPPTPELEALAQTYTIQRLRILVPLFDKFERSREPFMKMVGFAARGHVKTLVLHSMDLHFEAFLLPNAFQALQHLELDCMRFYIGGIDGEDVVPAELLPPVDLPSLVTFRLKRVCLTALSRFCHVVRMPALQMLELNESYVCDPEHPNDLESWYLPITRPKPAALVTLRLQLDNVLVLRPMILAVFVRDIQRCHSLRALDLNISTTHPGSNEGRLPGIAAVVIGALKSILEAIPSTAPLSELRIRVRICDPAALELCATTLTEIVRTQDFPHLKNLNLYIYGSQSHPIARNPLWHGRGVDTILLRADLWDEFRQLCAGNAVELEMDGHIANLSNAN
ncbi:BQ2448_6089 [Microbotryum intermedium]|uniref:BQ2448_6089 protein n=1 Tax=Microbotryum intermedium TaxID=269621 RepID=A0A238FLK3_9BASI|nr:BQ2448_6089 [Microbotryum intermedium]